MRPIEEADFNKAIGSLQITNVRTTSIIRKNNLTIHEF